MKSWSFLIAVVAMSVLNVEASLGHGDGLTHMARHARLSRQEPATSLTRSNLKKRCAKRPQPKNSSSTAKSTAKATSSAKSTKATTGAQAANNQSPAPVTGVLKVASSCGSIGAVQKTTGTAGPNGALKWLNCGIAQGSNSGWKPPYVTVSDLIAVDLTTALKDSSSPFKACSAYVSYFYKYAGEIGVPPIMLAAFALQESSCDPSTVGGGGEQGLMQITKDKCGGAPGGNCKDPDFNIRTGANYFKSVLDGNNGNVIESVGNYNGWTSGMTYADATAARYSSCCRCQNNLDYLQQFFNGWLQNINAYDSHLGEYFNLDVCPAN